MNEQKFVELLDKSFSYRFILRQIYKKEKENYQMKKYKTSEFSKFLDYFLI